MALKHTVGSRNGLLDTGDLGTLYANGRLDIYSGTAPATASAAETGTKLVSLTKDGGAFTPGSPTNGFNFSSAASSGVLTQDGNTYKGTALATGTAGYFRLYDNDVTTGADASAIRLQGTVGTSGADMIVSTASITAGAVVTLSSFSVTMPGS